MILDPGSQDVHISISVDLHSHNSSVRCPQLNPATKAKVLELLEAGVTKPRKILRQLEALSLPIINRIQINNLKQRLHTKVRLILNQNSFI